MAKVLFLPNYLGGGFGHIGRCIALAQAFCQKGGTAFFALNGPHLKHVREAGFTAHVLSTPRVPKPKAQGLAYVYVSDMAYQIVRDGFDNQQQVKAALKELMKVVEKTKPNVLIGDGYPMTWLVGKKAGIPVVQLVKSVVHPKPERMVWWEENPEGLIVPDVRPIFNPVLKKLGLPQIIKGAEELLSGDLLLLPSIPILDPMNPLSPNTYYVGPIIRTRATAQSLPPWLSALSSAKPVVYVTVGGAASHGGSYPFFNVAIKAFEDVDWQIIISTGGKVDPKTLGPVSPHIRIASWVPGTEMIARSDLVVFHGGYTRMEILMRGLPSVVIPFHSEQEYYGRLMEKAGVAIVVHYSEEPYQPFLCRWRGGNRWMKSKEFTLHVKAGMTLRPEFLRSAIVHCLQDSEMRLRVQALRAEIESYGGCDMAMDLIESRLL